LGPSCGHFFGRSVAVTVGVNPTPVGFTAVLMYAKRQVHFVPT
jgi:hypothetical protein